MPRQLHEKEARFQQCLVGAGEFGSDYTEKKGKITGMHE